jgi:hypothetical protein
MPVKVMRMLTIGEVSYGLGEILQRLEGRGWGSRRAMTVCEALELIASFRFDVVLAPEILSDGRGYDVTEAVVLDSGTLLVGVALSESRLWLPVVEKGERVLGTRAVKAGALAIEVEMVLTASRYASGYRDAGGNGSAPKQATTEVAGRRGDRWRHRKSESAS